MTAKLAVEMVGAAFDDQASELARILRATAEKIENGSLPPFNLRDANGNVVGWFAIE
jgi:hypothetical protein